MIADCHAHCLPAMDDGAADVAQALQMLDASRQQGVDTVVATPHFYAGQESVQQFLQRRQVCAEMLCRQLPTDSPRLLLGAEVLVREGVSRLDLRPLCIEGTNLLLLEMPFMPASYWLCDEIENIVFGQRLRVVLAHVERYMPWFSQEGIAQVADIPDVILQLNAEAFSDNGTFRKLRRWLPTGHRLLLGSDMHNMDKRPPRLSEARQKLSRHRIGRDWLSNMDRTAEKLLTTE